VKKAIETKLNRVPVKLKLRELLSYANDASGGQEKERAGWDWGGVQERGVLIA
jgi:hypothetical protein